MTTLTMTEAEANLLLNALYACVPTGGGSSQFSLYRKLAAAIDHKLDYQQVGYFQKVAHDEMIGE